MDMQVFGNIIQTFQGFFHEIELTMTNNVARHTLNPTTAPPIIIPYMATRYFTSSQLTIVDMVIFSARNKRKVNLGLWITRFQVVLSLRTPLPPLRLSWHTKTYCTHPTLYHLVDNGRFCYLMSSCKRLYLPKISSFCQHFSIHSNQVHQGG